MLSRDKLHLARRRYFYLTPDVGEVIGMVFRKTRHRLGVTRSLKFAVVWRKYHRGNATVLREKTHAFAVHNTLCFMDVKWQRLKPQELENVNRRWLHSFQNTRRTSVLKPGRLVLPERR